MRLYVGTGLGVEVATVNIDWLARQTTRFEEKRGADDVRIECFWGDCIEFTVQG